jgi:hypothetical protein
MASIGGGAAINPGGGWLRELIRWPSREFDIDTRLAPAEIVERLRAIIEPGSRFLALFKRRKKPFTGEVSADGFKVMRLAYSRNGVLPVVTGRFEPGPIGTRVRIAMRLPRQVAVFLVLWFAVFALAFAAPLFLSVTDQTKRFGRALTPMGFYGYALGLASFAYLMVAGSFAWEARRARGLLEEALEASTVPGIR